MESGLLNRIFDPSQFKQELADGKPPIPLFKQAGNHAQAVMDEHFREHKDAIALVHARSWFMDKLLLCAWDLYFPQDARNICLLAVGGYGRGELHPKSDIDVLILSEDESAFNQHSDAMQSFITFMWDIKLDVGHGVRTLDDCQKEAEKDITIATNLMETRTLAGPDSLRETMVEQTGPKHIWPSDQFFLAKWDEQKVRQEKHHDIHNNLEPNIKKGQGGLRYIHTIVWVMMRHFGTSSLEELSKREILTDFEYDVLLRCRDFLWQ